jgi:hypothetical protein
MAQVAAAVVTIALALVASVAAVGQGLHFLAAAELVVAQVVL